MGGPMGAYEEAEHPWLVDEKRSLREAVEADVPVWGVCLGRPAARLGARGAGVQAREPEVGVLPVELTSEAAEDPVFGARPAPSRRCSGTATASTSGGRRPARELARVSASGVPGGPLVRPPVPHRGPARARRPMGHCRRTPRASSRRSAPAPRPAARGRGGPRGRDGPLARTCSAAGSSTCCACRSRMPEADLTGRQLDLIATWRRSSRPCSSWAATPRTRSWPRVTRPYETWT